MVMYMALNKAAVEQVLHLTAATLLETYYLKILNNIQWCTIPRWIF